MAPQCLVGVSHAMRLMTEESFAPIVGIMPVDDDAEAVRLMNDSAFGLTASVWTRDEAAALEIGDRIETGTWFMNRCDYLDPALAWVGIKDFRPGLQPVGRGLRLPDPAQELPSADRALMSGHLTCAAMTMAIAAQAAATRMKVKPKS